MLPLGTLEKLRNEKKTTDEFLIKKRAPYHATRLNEIPEPEALKNKK